MHIAAMSGRGCTSSAVLGTPAPRSAPPRRMLSGMRHSMTPHQAVFRRGASIVRMGLGDRLLDYIEGGPKLRKWYGQGERLPADGGGMRGGDPEEEFQMQIEEDLPRDAVLVTDADSRTGEFVVLQLILARQKIRVLVKDVQAAKTGFGSYVTPIAGDVSSGTAVAQAVKGARAVIVAGTLGPHVLRLAKSAGVEHIVLPSLAGAKQSGFSLDGLLGSDGALRDPQREADVAACGIPHTIVRAGRVRDAPGGDAALRFGAFSSSDGSSGSPGGDISREDLARVLAGALEVPPSSSLSFTVASDGPGSGSPPEDWREALSSLRAA